MEHAEPADDPHLWNTHAAMELRRRAERIETAPTPCFLGEEHLSFRSLKDYAADAIDRITGSRAIDRDRCIYIIELDQGTSPEPVMTAYRQAKATSGLRLPRDNGIETRCLYLGSSFATSNRARTLHSRLRQHLIETPNSTYGLSLSKWASDLDGGIVVSAWQYPAMGRNEDEIRNVVLTVEDWLSSQMEPMLGQRGIRN